MLTLQGERPRFYEGQYLGADDLSALVSYLRTAEARHSLGGHTWGIAIGLQLTERTAPGGPKRVEVTLQPGFAWDGFGRPIANGRPTRLPEDLFADIPYHPVADDVAAGGTGRIVEVWLAYDERGSGNPAPGFETCAPDDQLSRVDESFHFEIGPQPPSRQRSPVAIGPINVDAEQALRQFDATQPQLYDQSVPHQTFPLDGKPPRWLIPIGHVRWIARDNALGYFAERNLDPAGKVEGRTRAFRRYVGSVAEYIEAADGAIVLHARGKSPTEPSRFATLLQSTLDPAALLEDLVWIEGNLRVIGDGRLCGGQLDLRNSDGGNEGTPFYIARRGDNPVVPAAGKRELRVVLGPAAQTDNRLIVGPEVPPVAPSTDPGVAPHLVVVSSGDVGIGRPDPETRLNVVGGRIRLQSATSGAIQKLDLRTDGSEATIESSTHSLTVRSSAPAPANKVLINPEPTDGQVGIRVKIPQYDVDASGKQIKLGLEPNGGGQLILANNPGDNRIYLEGFNTTGDGHAAEMLITGRWAAPLPLFTARANVIQLSGTVGVGTNTPQAPLHVAGSKLRIDGAQGQQAILGGEQPGAIALGSDNGATDRIDMRQLSVGWSLFNPAAWLNVVCRNLYEFSDARGKSDVQGLKGSLDRVARLRGVSYRLANEQKGDEYRMGLIAQEVGEIVPEAVLANEQHHAIAYSTFIPLLIEAVKELKQQVADLRDEVTSLSAKPSTRSKRAAGKGKSPS